MNIWSKLRALALALLLAMATTSGVAQAPAPYALPNAALLDPGTITQMAPLPDGGRIVAGDFSSINGMSWTRTAKLRPDGSVDPNWQAPALDGITDIAVDGAGDVYVARGDVPGQPSSIVKLSGASGALIPQFSTTSADTISSLLVRNDSLYAIGFWPLPDGGWTRIGKLSLVTGDVDGAFHPEVDPRSPMVFDAAGRLYVGVVVVNNLRFVRILPSGEIDSAWNGAASNGGASSVAIDASHLYVAGAAPISPPGPYWVSRIVLATGQLDPNWRAQTDTAIHTVAPDSMGGAWLGGDFHRVNAQPSVGLAHLDAANVVDTSDPLDVFGTVYEIAREADGSLAVAGQFARIGAAARLSLARFSPDGVALAPAGSVEIAGTGASLVRQPDGRVLLGGSLARIGNHLTGNVARLAGNGSVDRSWTSAVDGDVNVLLLDPVDGAVVAAGTVYRHDVALTTATGFTGLGKLRGSDGALLTAWRGNLGEITVNGLWLSPDRWLVAAETRLGAPRRLRIDAPYDIDSNWPLETYSVSRMQAVLADGAGSLYLLGGSILKVNAATGAVIWRKSPQGFPGLAHTAVLHQGALFVGGSFCGIDTPGAASPCGLAKLSPATGDVDPSWSLQTNTEPGGVRAMVVAPSGELIVGGAFATLGGLDQPNLARINTAGAGSVVPNWNPRPDAAVLDLMLDGPNRLLVTGNFRTMGNTARGGLAALPLSASNPVLFADGFE